MLNTLHKILECINLKITAILLLWNYSFTGTLSLSPVPWIIIRSHSFP